MPILSVHNLTKRYNRTVALRDVSFQVEQGENLLVRGANGSGKSTLLSCLAGVLRADTGAIEWTFSEGRKRRVGFVSQASFLYGDLTIRENLSLAQTLADAGSAAQLLEVIESFHLQAEAMKRVRETSSGIHRRASLARAFIAHPEVLLLDEPYTNLDSDGRIHLRALLISFQKSGGTLIWASHEPDSVHDHSGRTVLLEAGSIVSAQPQSSAQEISA